MTPILGSPSATLDQALRWAVEADCSPLFASVVPLYFWASDVIGVDPAVAIAQAAHESGFGRMGRALTPSHHQLAGLKIKVPGDLADDDPRAHWTAPDWATGVVAHLHHLALYAGAPGYPCTGSPDPRHFPSLFGKATTVEGLSSHWAGAGYGERVARVLMGLWSTPRLGEL